MTDTIAPPFSVGDTVKILVTLKDSEQVTVGRRPAWVCRTEDDIRVIVTEETLRRGELTYEDRAPEIGESAKYRSGWDNPEEILYKVVSIEQDSTGVAWAWVRYQMPGAESDQFQTISLSLLRMVRT